MIHEELSGKIIGAGMDVLNELRPGLDEKLYERAMIIELKRRGHSLSIQRAFPVFYRSELIGNLIPDLIVDDAVIVDPKVAACFTDTHIAQMLRYLNITALDLTLLLNFKNARWERSEEHTSELQSRFELVCRLLLEKKTHQLYRQSRHVCPQSSSLPGYHYDHPDT